MPDALSLGPLLVRILPVALLVGGLAAAWLAGPLARRLALPPDALRTTLEVALVGGVLGARLVHVLVHWPAYADRPWTALYLWQPGFEPGYGVATGVALAFLALRRRPLAERGRALAAVVTATVGGATIGAALFGLLVALAPRMVGPGDRLPAAALVDLDGRPVDLADLAGRPAVVNLWATWCPPCRREMPLLTAAARAEPPGGVRIVGIDVGEPADVVRRFVAAHDVGHEVWLDPPGVTPSPSRALMDTLGGVGLPVTWFVAADGTVAGVHTGELSATLLADWLKRLHGG